MVPSLAIARILLVEVRLGLNDELWMNVNQLKDSEMLALGKESRGICCYRMHRLSRKFICKTALCSFAGSMR